MNKYDLSVIVVVKDNLAGIQITLESIWLQSTSSKQIIVIDGDSEDGTREYLFSKSSLIDVYVSEPDTGIYNAMNKGISKAKGSLLLFINSGDYICGDILKKIDRPGLLPIKYNNKRAILRPNIFGVTFLGMPYCHQGIVFQNDGTYYDESLLISSDYHFFLQAFDKNMPAKIPDIFDGFIVYEGGGISQKNKVLRDQESLSIVKRSFGQHIYAFSYLIFAIKKLLRRFL